MKIVIHRDTDIILGRWRWPVTSAQLNYVEKADAMFEKGSRRMIIVTNSPSTPTIIVNLRLIASADGFDTSASTSRAKRAYV